MSTQYPEGNGHGPDERGADGRRHPYRFGSPVAWSGLIVALTLAVQSCTDLVQRTCTGPR